ncbi:hypothetical protein BDZ97DRAFT_1426170 [Flammula alnicola]|nr:hypothetical protein BDZ97DRAFT_1426170 [Flammula alnicola]
MLAPQPLAAALRIRDQDSSIHPYSETDFTGMPLERLRSPIHLTESGITPPPPASTPVSSRTRSKAAAHSARRRRLPPRIDYTPSHVFDDLPWISTLDTAPEHLNPWDIADLSLISDSFSDPLSSSSGPGPVRRRKTSLRSSPIISAKNGSPGSSPPRETFFPNSQPVSTPPSRFIPSRVLFHHLMPVSCDFRPEQSRPCITRSRINF